MPAEVVLTVEVAMQAPVVPGVEAVVMQAAVREEAPVHVPSHAGGDCSTRGADEGEGV